MKGRPILISVLALGLMLALAAGLTLAQGPGPQGDVGIQSAPVSSGFTYQGRLSDGGSAANGTYDFEFNLYNAARRGAQVGSTITKNDVAVTDGMFTVGLDFGSGVFTGDARWLEIGVRQGASTSAYTTLTPRQALTATPYALYALSADTTYLQRRVSDSCTSGNAIRLINEDGTVTCEPVTGGGAHDHLGETWTGSNPLTISGDFADAAPLVLSNGGAGAASGLTLQPNRDGLRILSAADDGVQIDSAGQDGVIVLQNGRDAFSAVKAGGDGLYVKEAGDDGVDVREAGDDGVYVGTTGNPSTTEESSLANGFEVAGAEGNGLYVGQADSSGVFVYGAELNGFWVHHTGFSGFQVGDADANGVWVQSAGLDGLRVDNASRYGVFVDQAVDHGVYVVNTAGPTISDGFRVDRASGRGLNVLEAGFEGVRVESAGSDGVHVASANQVGVYANTNSVWGFYTPDKVYAGNGYVDIAEHIDAASDVEPGDVVVIDPDHDERVVKSTKPYDTSVAGIISTDPAMLIGKSDTETPLALAGRAPCKVSAENGPIHRGDLLTTSSTPGHAMKATDPQLGTILGKALGELESGTGVIYVLVTLQ